jgi:SAM-dependent methyltransferase
LRVLDVGCSDAAIALWLARQLDGTPLHVDGLDLDPNMVVKAQQRANEQGLPGVFKYGSALDAATLFEPGTYDVVVGFEILEHVPEVEPFLDALEAMVKPGGLVMLSTPDGVFGEGSNEHHLRVYRAVDLADLLRRRGQLVNMAVGSDAVAVASYRPGPRKDDIAIYLGACWNRWSPTDIETRGLGGSETAAVRLAEALSALGFVVTVYGDCAEMCRLDVIYRHYSAFDPLDRRGALICSRIPEVGDRPIAAATRLLWCHDVDFGDRLTAGRLERFDYILGLSRWHVDHLKGRYPYAADKVLQTRNGITPALFGLA